MLRTASLHPAERGLSLRFDGGFSPDAGSQLPGTLASPRVGLSPTGRAQLRWAHRGKALLTGETELVESQSTQTEGHFRDAR
jgi:hypothetical protein